MKKIEIVKKTIVLVISAGVALVVRNAVRATTPFDVKGINKLCINVGTFVLAGMISDKVSDYTEEQIDDVISSIRETNEEIAAEKEKTTENDPDAKDDFETSPAGEPMVDEVPEDMWHKS